ncbi:uncharacterized protein LOC119650372 [Hermetia illucens]|uniref:uncharacterized protein LOC119650372 n=1 Tax=Hermetia illucens TaxID=343691 RepID=UPI0018CC231D|nr:uncharacterized protein LOC119650372 [Hermetia illucens]XP_037909032.1 uncharacterized protein LOC119650372 [Hermetia illucens]
MPSRSPSQWQSRRKQSLGKLRRAHPASGATWNVQVVRGKMTSKCLWHACRALALGMVLMLLGAGMATVGYYADQLSVGHEIRGNATIRVKNESRGFHLNNLSYVGPIVMGFGGFIVVAACVMTFEARDSAAKVVPARLKVTGNSRNNVRSNTSSATSARRANEMMHQATRWDYHLGVFRTSPADPPQPLTPMDRQAMTAALIHFSKTLGNSPRQSPKSRRISRSGSVPNLTSSQSLNVNSAQLSPSYRKKLALGQGSHHHHHQQHHHRHGHQGRHLPNHKTNRISSSLINRASRESTNSLLHPGMLQYHRHALSVDETGPYFRSSVTPHDSQSSMIIPDSHEARIRDRTFRSDTAKKHVLARQKPIEKEEPHSPKTAYTNGRRRSSTASDISFASRCVYRRTSSASRTPSIDSRSVQVELHSPEKSRQSPRTPRRLNSGQSSTPSVEREFRSQLSICSEPTTTIRQLSGQSSLEPCVLEESPELEESQHLEETASGPSTSLQTKIEEDIAIENSQDCLVHANLKKSRPNSLILDASGENSKSSKAIEAKKFLYRSRSSRTFYRPKPRLINEYDPIYFISTDGSIRTRPYDKDEELYDSLQVINERRSKILTTTTTTTTSTISSDIIESSGENCILEASNTLEEFDEDNKSLESLSDAATSMVDPKTQDKSVAPPLEEKDIVLVHNAMLLENDECSKHDATKTVLNPTSPAGGKSELIENKCEEHGQETTENEVLDTRIIMEADAE